MDSQIDLETLRYPIGRFSWDAGTGAASRDQWLRVIEATPAELRRAVSGLNDKQLDTPYRPDGWTVRQVVHHFADDHLNSYVRFKLALTEDAPTIKGYEEALWAELPDARQGPRRTFPDTTGRIAPALGRGVARALRI
ncbi:MAG: DinB family protein [Candidatus Acidiferrales bacterium]